MRGVNKYFIPVGLKLINVCETLAKLDSLFRRKRTINSRLYFGSGSFAATIYKGGNIKSFTWMVRHVVCDRHGRFAKDIANFGRASVTKQVFSRILNTGIQYLPEDSIQTSTQEYLASHAANSLRPLEKEEK